MKTILLLATLFPIFASAQTKTSTTTPAASTTRFQQANDLLAKGEVDKVVELLNPYTDQLSQPGYLLLANAYSRKKDFTNEIRVLNLLVSKDEENYRWQMLLSQAYLKQAKVTKEPIPNKELVDKGIQKLRRVLELSPKYKPAFDQLVQTLLAQKAHYEAREVLTEGISKFGRRPEIFKELCRLDSTDGFLVQAIKACRESIKISPEYPDSYVYLAQSLSDTADLPSAEREIVQAARKFPKSEFVQWAAGKFFTERKNLSVAKRYFAQSVTAMPGSGRGQFGLAQAMLELGEYEQALPVFKTACQLEPNTTYEVFMNAASRLRQKGISSLAEKYSSAAYACKK